jgi:hypothetical protein
VVAGAGSAGGILAVGLGKFRKFFSHLLAMMPLRFRYPLTSSGWERTFTSKLPNMDGVAKKGRLKRPPTLKLPAE